MREIKFRGWDEKNKEMVDNINLLFSNHLNECFEEYEECGLKIMQYTGLKDKNGQEICEGDILYISQMGVISNSFEAHDENRKVLFYEGSFCIENYAKSENLDIENHYGIGLYHTPDELEVIGNIYENPELLEAE